MQNRQKEAVKTTVGTNKSARLAELIHWIRSTKSMELFNNINGIVQQNQCLRFPKAPV
jgi:hypothetical protein